MHLSVLLTSFPADFVTAVRQAEDLGFRFVDVVAQVERPPADVEALADTALHVSCVSLGRGLPPDYAPDAPSVDTRRAVLQALKQQLADAGRLGATHAYLISGSDSTSDGVKRFEEVACRLADYAATRMIRLCVEHIPGRALPTAAATLAWLRATGHPNLRLLLDVGHCAMTSENPAHTIDQAGSLLGYVHLDDNDGVKDLHWPLLAGCLTRSGLRAVLTSLRANGYNEALTLEYTPDHPALLQALAEGKTLLEDLLGTWPNDS